MATRPPKPPTSPKKDRDRPPTTDGATEKKPSPYEVAKRDRAALKKRLLEFSELAYVDTLNKCESEFILHCLTCDHTRKGENGCKRRWCPVCARRISAERAAKFAHAVSRMDSPLFVTLTIQNTEDARAGLNHLRKSFGKFKRAAWFKRLNVKGGLASMEITNRGKGWHPHLHVVLDCRWLAKSRLQPQPGDSKAVIKSKCAASQAELSQAWATASNQPSAVVWVKKADASIVTEVTKYAVKPGDLVKCQDNPGDIIRAMEKTRLVTTWGSCYGVNRELKILAAEDREPCKCEHCQTSNWMPETVWSAQFGRTEAAAPSYYATREYRMMRHHQGD